MADETLAVVRRAPYSSNPVVGARGQRAQQRILDAALDVFGKLGYHRTGIANITDVAGCTRASFYQYFSSKEDVFRRLAGEVARQLVASAKALDAITPDREGWESVHAWITRHGDIYEQYRPVFEAYHAAEESDTAVASGSALIRDRHIETVRARVSPATLPRARLGAVIDLLLDVMTRTRQIGGRLQSALEGSALDRERLDRALADVVHRSLHRRDDDVNVQPPVRGRFGRVPDSARLLAELNADASLPELSAAGERTFTALVTAAHDVLVARGYHGTRVDDITDAAGLSHGAFYRYFDNKDAAVRYLAGRAMQRVSGAINDIPDADAGSAALRAWLRSYATTHASQAALIRVWIDATADDEELSLESAAGVDWGRARLTRFLAPRGFGDVDTEALLLVVLLDSLGVRGGEDPLVDAAAHIIERGLLGVT